MQSTPDIRYEDTIFAFMAKQVPLRVTAL